VTVSEPSELDQREFWFIPLLATFNCVIAMANSNDRFPTPQSVARATRSCVNCLCQLTLRLIPKCLTDSRF